MTRYDIEGAEGESEPGSGGAVLRNRVGITNPDHMDELELILLEHLYEDVLIKSANDRPVRVDDLKEWHRRWLGNV